MRQNSLRRCWVVLVACLAAAPAWGQPAKPKTWTEQPLNDELVGEAVRRGMDYLWGQQQEESHWEPYTKAQFAEVWKKRDELMKTWQRATYVHDHADYGGRTALALLALLKSGADANDPRFDRGIRFLLEAPAIATYPHSLRGLLFASLPGDRHRDQVLKEKLWLLDAIYANGGTGYLPPLNNDRRMNPKPNYTDLSNTQYAVLAGWALDDAGGEVPARYWQLIQGHFLAAQRPDGGWGYRLADNPAKPPADSYQTMTMAGLASLFIVWDKLYAADCNRPPDPNLVAAIDRGLNWAAQNFSVTHNTGKDRSWLAYNLYGIERVGVASGLKYFGEHNWYDQGARYALFHQRADGSFRLPGSKFRSNDMDDTAYALLFLSYGRAPVVFNKLAYGDAERKLNAGQNVAQWNARPRDLARLTTWMGKTYERLFNWQIMPIERPLAELLDAPILMLSGRAPVRLTDEEKAKLKDYVLGGGLLVGEAIEGSRGFSDSFRALVAELFPELEMRLLSADHPIYTVKFRLSEPAAGRMPPPPLEGLSNGVRTLVVLSPRELGCTWQRYDVLRGRSYFELGANLAQYVSDHLSGLIGRGSSYLVADQGNRPDKTVTVGRVVWGNRYQWDPEPFGWRRQDVLLRNAGRAGVRTVELDLAAAVNAKDLPVVHLTGVGPIHLDEAQKTHLKQYVLDGGLLLVDAAGGSRAFADSFGKLAGDLFGPLVPSAAPFAAQATDGGRTTLRHVDGLPRAIRPLTLLGWQGEADRWGVVFVPYDLTAAMAGYPNVEPVGLTPDAADRFVAALIDWLVAR